MPDPIIEKIKLKNSAGEQVYPEVDPSDKGTDVIANPTLAGTEGDLTALQVGETKYKVAAGGGAVDSVNGKTGEVVLYKSDIPVEVKNSPTTEKSYLICSTSTYYSIVRGYARYRLTNVSFQYGNSIDGYTEVDTIGKLKTILYQTDTMCVSFPGSTNFSGKVANFGQDLTTSTIYVQINSDIDSQGSKSAYTIFEYIEIEYNTSKITGVFIQAPEN